MVETDNAQIKLKDGKPDIFLVSKIHDSLHYTVLRTEECLYFLLHIGHYITLHHVLYFICTIVR